MNDDRPDSGRTWCLAFTADRGWHISDDDVALLEACETEGLVPAATAAQPARQQLVDELLEELHRPVPPAPTALRPRRARRPRRLLRDIDQGQGRRTA